MSRKSWWIIIGVLAAIAVGVQVTWVVVLSGLRLPVAAIVVLVFFPGAMGWCLPLGFAWLWKDEVKPAEPGPRAS